MTKKWVPTLDGHDVELVEIDDQKIRLVNSVSRIVHLDEEQKRGVASSSSFLIHPTITHSSRHPRYRYLPKQHGDLSCSQIDRVLHVLGEYFPPNDWNLGEVLL